MKRVARLASLALMPLLIGACSQGPTEAEPLTTTTAATPPRSLAPAPRTLDAMPTVEALMGGRSLTLAVADDDQERADGLMRVANLGDLDGMLFVFEDDTEVGFWMKDVVLPLDIGFFDAEGAFLMALTMEPCSEDPCITYRPGVTYRYAVEVPAGSFAWADLVLP